jgi:hypothetical protein
VPKPMKLNKEMKNKRKIIMRSFSIAKNLYATGRGKCSSKHLEFETRAEFLEVTNCINIIIVLNNLIIEINMRYTYLYDLFEFIYTCSHQMLEV